MTFQIHPPVVQELAPLILQRIPGVSRQEGGQRLTLQVLEGLLQGATAPIVAGDLVYISSNETVQVADASSTTTMPAIGFASHAATSEEGSRLVHV